MNRIWVDGCFDFFHHGHAGALHQARALGDELIVGIHTDKEILANKGPVVMHLDERAVAVDACRWTSQVVLDAPYVTQFAVMDKYKCHYVAHGDDITTDANGNDCYQAAKDAKRFLVFKRTPNISTTDLISRMLLRTTTHHAESSLEFLTSDDALSRFRMYATDFDARTPYAGVYAYDDGKLTTLVPKNWKHSDVVYTEGTFDLFHPGHIEFLAKLKEANPGLPIVVGLRSDKSANEVLADGRPIMNTFERALCLLQCKYVAAVILNVPFAQDGAKRVDFINKQLKVQVVKVARGDKIAPEQDILTKWAGTEPEFLIKIPPGKYMNLNTHTIISRVLSNRAQYEERQRKKGVKAANEQEMATRERNQSLL